MEFIADFHIHSRFSRATSRDLTLEALHASALEKPGEESKWVTLAALTVVKRCHDFLTGSRLTDVLSDLKEDDPRVLRRTRSGTSPEMSSVSEPSGWRTE